jgi:hypothetical protein
MAVQDKKVAREELRKKLAARKAERAVEASSKYARMRQVAAEESKEVDAALSELAEALGGMADAMMMLKENLGLIQAPKTAALSVRMTAARKYAAPFKELAEKSPDVIADALNEVYQALDEVGAGIETLADNMGVELVPAEEEMEAEPSGIKTDEAFKDFKENQTNEEPEEKDATSDEPEEAPEHGDEEPKEAAGADMFITDRGNDGKPEAPTHMEIPQAQGKAASKREEIRQRILARKK